MKKQQVIILVIVLVLVAAGAVAWVTSTPQPDPANPPVADKGNVPTTPVPTNGTTEPTTTPEVITSDIDTREWMMYRNEKFEFKYPTTWESQAIENGIMLTIPNSENRPQLYYLGKISVYWSGTDVENLLQVGRDKLIKPWLDELGIKKEIPENKIVVDGNTITVLGPFSPPSNMTDEIYVVVSDGRSTVVLSGTIFGGDTNIINKQIVAIYSSIRFYRVISTTIDTSDWKTYQSERLKIDFMYPKDWRVEELGEYTVGLFPPNRTKAVEYNGDISFFFRKRLANVDIDDVYNGEKGPEMFKSATGGYWLVKISNNDAYYFDNVMGLMSSDVVVIPVDGQFIEVSAIDNHDAFKGVLNTVVIH